MHISDIDSLTNFKRDTSKFMRRMSRTRRPMALTVNGKAKLLIMDANVFKYYEDYLEHVEVISRVKQGIADVKAGLIHPADEVFDGVFKKLKNANRKKS